MNLLAEASTKERASTTPLSPEKPLKLAQLHAANTFWLMREFFRTLPA